MKILVFELLNLAEVYAVGSHELILGYRLVIVQGDVIMVLADGHGRGFTLEHNIASLAVARIVLHVMLHVEEGQLAIGRRHQNS